MALLLGTPSLLYIPILLLSTLTVPPVSAFTMAGSKRPNSKMVQSALDFGATTNTNKKARGSSSSASSASSSAYRIYCDMDGVLTDFDTAVTRLCGKPPSEISAAYLWSTIAKTDSFFRDLAWTSDGQALWDAIRPLRPDILTGVSRASVSSEKFEWCKQELCVETTHVDMAAPKRAHERVSGVKKKGITNVITCWSKNKHYESGPKRVLIDDREGLKEAWEAAGGIFILHIDTESSLRQLREKGILPEPSSPPAASSETTEEE